jgi:Uma2 family endonuclease
MSTIAAAQPMAGAPGALTSGPSLYRFTVAQFDRMLRDETIGPRERVELIDGLVVTKVSKNPPHIHVGKLLFFAFTKIVPKGWHISKDDDVVVSDHDKPQPDLAIVRGELGDYPDRYVTSRDIALATEISESTLASDRSLKMPRYALAKIPVYWIVNLVDEQVEVYTDPVGATYTNRTVFPRGEQVPVVVDGKVVGQIAVSDILPPGPAA